MKISTKGEYGIRAMLYIAMHADEGPVTSHEIAVHQGIPEPYLRQILALLSKDRLILSNRGPQGGHVLGRPASQISLRHVMVTLEGQTTAIDQILALPCTIDVGTEHCAIREVFLEVKQAIDRILSATTLEEMVNRQREILVRNIAVPLDLPSATSARASLLPVITD
ncbi:MAG: Rrf2 family transcriptional regulator, cysteine metabolism repressor [Acidobacteriota bacterium]|jgi:Rrf2 family protein|nr:Rrf2 family transcriptional regulator, cysteine metabolism repressor [Acidobacteriota bacterium]